MHDSLRKGNDINLTVDSDTCAAAYDVLSGYGKDGACVVYNYKTGEVICSVSTKAYDPEAVSYTHLDVYKRQFECSFFIILNISISV